MHAVVDVPAHLEAAAADFWTAALGWPLGEPWDQHPELRSFEPPDGQPYVHLQQIVGEPRVHLDLDAADQEAGVADAVAAGAHLVSRSDRWVTLRSPGGLPFCVVGAQERAVPGPLSWGDGHHSRLVQVCVDAPADRVDREVEFWRNLLPGGWSGSAAPEFAGRWHGGPGSPLQLLFQRLGETWGEVRAHLDLGTDDRAAEVHRLRALGAHDLATVGPGWRVLADPAGLPFCVTDNSPGTTG